MKAIAGCLVSLAYFAFLGMLVFATMLGDCFDEVGHRCPTDHERNVTIVLIIVVGLGLYWIAGVLIGRLLARRGRDRD